MRVNNRRTTFKVLFMPCSRLTRKALNGYRPEQKTLYRAVCCHQADRSKENHRRYDIHDILPNFRSEHGQATLFPTEHHS